MLVSFNEEKFGQIAPPPPDADRQRRLAQLEDRRAKLRASILAE